MLVRSESFANTYRLAGQKRMSKQIHHKHGHHNHHAGHGAPKRKIHHDWKFWTAVVLMLGAMAIYVMSDDESLLPRGQEQEPVPAAAE